LFFRDPRGLAVIARDGRPTRPTTNKANEKSKGHVDDRRE
jgi:hypothetical protein